MKTRIMLMLPLVALCAVLPACQSERAPEEVVVKLNTIHSEVSTGRDAIVHATESAKALRNTNAAGLKPMYASFAQSVDDLTAKAGGVGLVMDSAQANTDKFFAQWDSEIQQISDNDLRTRAEDRRATVLAKYQDIQSKITKLRSSFRPYYSKLQDIKKFLGTDTTPGALSSATGPINDAIELSGPVMKDIDSLLAAIEKVTGK